VILSTPTIHAQTSCIREMESCAYSHIGCTFTPESIFSSNQSYMVRTIRQDQQIKLLNLLSQRQDFTVYAQNKIVLTINSAYAIQITLDGINQGPDVSAFELDPGQHTFSVPGIVQLGTGSRLK